MYFLEIHSMYFLLFYMELLFGPWQMPLHGLPCYVQEGSGYLSILLLRTIDAKFKSSSG